MQGPDSPESDLISRSGLFSFSGSESKGQNLRDAGMLTIGKAVASITLDNLNFTYDGSSKSVSVTTNPAGLDVVVTYNGSQTPPSDAGTYNVAATINDPNYRGTAGGTMTIAEAGAAAVPAMGPWGMLVAAGGLGIIGTRKARRKISDRIR